MKTRSLPQVSELDARDVASILARNNVGRLAFAWGGEVDIRPVHYVYRDGVLYGRTSHGAKFVDLETLPARVAFEVDEVESVSRWRSVIVRGEFDVLFPEGSLRQEWEHAVEHLRTLVNGTFAESDPTPYRSVVFRITVQQATGRVSG
jgi:uncharacterized protein